MYLRMVEAWINDDRCLKILLRGDCDYYEKGFCGSKAGAKRRPG
jgi:hypothetical protein